MSLTHFGQKCSFPGCDEIIYHIGHWVEKHGFAWDQLNMSHILHCGGPGRWCNRMDDMVTHIIAEPAVINLILRSYCQVQKFCLAELFPWLHPRPCCFQEWTKSSEPHDFPILIDSTLIHEIFDKLLPILHEMIDRQTGRNFVELLRIYTAEEEHLMKYYIIDRIQAEMPAVLNPKKYAPQIQNFSQGRWKLRQNFFVEVNMPIIFPVNIPILAQKTAVETPEAPTLIEIPTTSVLRSLPPPTTPVRKHKLRMPENQVPSKKMRLEKGEEAGCEEKEMEF